MTNLATAPAPISVAAERLAASPAAADLDRLLFYAAVDAFKNFGVVYELLRLQGSPSASPNWLAESCEELHRLVAREGTAANVSAATISTVVRLLHTIPRSAPRPELAIEDDGNVAVEWQASKKWVLVASVGEGSTVYYAGLFGANRYRGAEHFDRNLPTGLGENLARYITPPLDAEIIFKH